MNRHQQLNGKQRAFLKAYLGRDPKLHGNATRCYKAVYGLTDTRSASVCGSKMINHPVIKPLIAEATARLDEKIIVDAGFVLTESKRLYDRAMGDAPISDRVTITTDPETGAEIVTTEQRHEYDAATARQALQLIGQHKSVQAFAVTVEHSHTHKLEQRLQARSKAIEGKAARIEGEAQQLPYLGSSSVVEQGSDQPTVEGQERVPSSGGQTDERADEE